MRRPAGDVDIDFADRTKALNMLDHTPASIIRNKTIVKHNTGVYFHTVPVDPLSGLASIGYDAAENIGWYKVDLLNVSVYELIKSEDHLIKLMAQDLDWDMFTYPEFTAKLIHLGNHADMVAALQPRSIQDIAMILALIRPGKRYLVEKCKLTGFSSIINDIWTVTEHGYAFHKSHATSYAMLVKVHASLLVEQALLDF